MNDVDKLEQLWIDHSHLVREFLDRRCTDRATVDDLTAETFVHAARAIDAERDVTIAWLMTVARRRLIDHWRSTGRADKLFDRLERERTHWWHEQPALTDGGLDAAISALCESQQSALCLRYVADESVQQIADQLELSYAATESLLARGRRRLAREYEACAAAA